MSKNFSEDLVSSMFLDDQGDDTHPSVTECQQFLYADPRIKYFFEVSLPASQRRKEVLGHILFVCPDTRTRTYFLQMLQNRHPVNYSMTKFNSIGQPGDLVGLLTNMSLGDALVCEAQSANIQDSLIEILPAALSSFVSDIVIGKGPSAQSIRINLPKFTFVACVANETSAIRKLLPHFEYVLKVDNTSLPNLCAAQLHSSASAASISIDDTACDLIISKAQYDVTQSERYLKRIWSIFPRKKVRQIALQENLLNMCLIFRVWLQNLRYLQMRKKCSQFLEIFRKPFILCITTFTRCARMSAAA